MNTTISTAKFAALGIFMFSLSCFGQETRLHDLSVFQKYDHSLSTNEIDEIDNDYLKWLLEQARETVPDGPLPQGPGPFLPETDVHDGFLYGPVMMARWQDGGFHFEFGLVEISNGFVKLGDIKGNVWEMERQQDSAETGDDLWSDDELAILPEDDLILSFMGLISRPWMSKDDDGILDQEKEFPSDDDRSDHPRDR